MYLLEFEVMAVGGKGLWVRVGVVAFRGVPDVVIVRDKSGMWVWGGVGGVNIGDLWWVYSMTYHSGQVRAMIQNREEYQLTPYVLAPIKSIRNHFSEWAIVNPFSVSLQVGNLAEHPLFQWFRYESKYRST
jgi:hypothetical protein